MTDSSSSVPSSGAVAPVRPGACARFDCPFCSARLAVPAAVDAPGVVVLGVSLCVACGGCGCAVPVPGWFAGVPAGACGLRAVPDVSAPAAPVRALAGVAPEDAAGAARGWAPAPVRARLTEEEVEAFGLPGGPLPEDFSHEGAASSLMAPVPAEDPALAGAVAAVLENAARCPAGLEAVLLDGGPFDGLKPTAVRAVRVLLEDVAESVIDQAVAPGSVAPGGEVIGPLLDSEFGGVVARALLDSGSGLGVVEVALLESAGASLLVGGSLCDLLDGPDEDALREFAYSVLADKLALACSGLRGVDGDNGGPEWLGSALLLRVLDRSALLGSALAPAPAFSVPETKNLPWGFFGEAVRAFGVTRAAGLWEAAVLEVAARASCSLEAAAAWLDSRGGRVLGDGCFGQIDVPAPVRRFGAALGVRRAFLRSKLEDRRWAPKSAGALAAAVDAAFCASVEGVA